VIHDASTSRAEHLGLVEDQIDDVLSPRGALETHGRGGQCRRDDLRLQLDQVLHGVLRNGRELHP